MKMLSKFTMICILLPMSYSLSMLAIVSNSDFAGGDGSVEYPYQITTVGQLQNVKSYLSDNFIIMNDIDASETTTWNAGAGFEPIGTSSARFTGILDGQNFVVSDLYINRNSTDYVGLFGFADNASEIYNLGLENADITGYDYTGILSGAGLGSINNCYTSGSVRGNRDVGGFGGYLDGNITSSYSTATVIAADYGSGGFTALGYGVFTDCFSTGDVNGISDVGGFIGTSYGTVSNCHSKGNVTASDDYAGGFIAANYGEITGCYSEGSAEGVGYVGGFAGMNWGTITDSYSTGTATGADWGTGGFTGSHSGTLISECYSTGNVWGLYSVGGFSGDSGNEISNCYAKGNVTADDEYAGGFVGYSWGTTTACYSIGTVSGNGFVGGFSGDDSGIATACYWDTETSGIDSTASGYGKTTLEMQTQSTFAGWDFTTPVWEIDGINNDAYPYLQWQIFESTLGIPQNLATEISGTDLILSWDPVTGASCYIVYSSDDPYGVFNIEDTVTETTWTETYSSEKKFYRIASSDSK